MFTKACKAETLIIFYQNVDEKIVKCCGHVALRAVLKCGNPVDPEKCRRMSTSLHKSASIQPRPTTLKLVTCLSAGSFPPSADLASRVRLPHDVEHRTDDYGRPDKHKRLPPVSYFKHQSQPKRHILPEGTAGRLQI